MASQQYVARLGGPDQQHWSEACSTAGGFAQ